MGKETRGGEFLAGLIIGGLVGAAVALLFAPQPGEETRTRLREKGIELQERLTEVGERGKEVFQEQRVRLEEAIEEGKEAAEKKKEELLAQLEAEKKGQAKKKT